jgi:hypothetical protein
VQLADEPRVRREVTHSEVLKRLNSIAPAKKLLNLDSLDRARKPLGV